MKDLKNVAPDKKSVVGGPELALDMMHAGFTKFLPVATTVVVSGKSLTQPELLKAIDAFRSILKTERETKDAYEAAHAERVAKTDEIAEAISEFKLAAKSHLGARNTALKEFGIGVKRDRRELTPEERLLRAERARRTRKARHTLGSRQKEAIVGDEVDSLVVRPAGPPGSAEPGTGTGPTPTRIPA